MAHESISIAAMVAIMIAMFVKTCIFGISLINVKQKMKAIV